MAWLKTDLFVCSEGGALWEPDSAASHVGASSENPSLRAAAQRLSSPAARGRPGLQGRPEYETPAANTSMLTLTHAHIQTSSAAETCLFSDPKHFRAFGFCILVAGLLDSIRVTESCSDC